MQGTCSVGITLLFWLCGVVYTLAGTHLFIEYGLTTPRHTIDGREQGVPRSGGTLNYVSSMRAVQEETSTYNRQLQYVFTRPAYRNHTVMFSTCVFGIAYIILGNMAGNSITFAVRLFEAAGVTPENGPVRGVAIAAATVSCFVHATSRRGGIWLSNIFAAVKVLILLLIIVTGIVAYCGTFKSESFAAENLAPKNAFSGAADDSYGYAQAFLGIIFAFNGFEQPNYVRLASSGSLLLLTSDVGAWRDRTTAEEVPMGYGHECQPCLLPIRCSEHHLRTLSPRMNGLTLLGLRATLTSCRW